MSRVEQMRALLGELESLAERAREHEHRMAVGVQESASWPLQEDREWIAWAAAEAGVAREDAEARVTQGRVLVARAQRDHDREG
jgi:hypothetical protein